jgi:cobalt/nickel transport system permease protein
MFRIGAAAGGIGVLLTGLLVVLSLVLSDRAFLPAAQVLAVSVLPLALVEALITGTVLSFLARVDPGSVLGEGAGRA